LNKSTIPQRVEIFLSNNYFPEEITQILSQGSMKSKNFMVEFLNIFLIYAPNEFRVRLLDLQLVELLLELFSLDDEKCQMNIIQIFYLMFKKMETSDLLQKYIDHLNETEFWDYVEQNLDHSNTCIAEYCQEIIDKYFDK